MYFICMYICTTEEGLRVHGTTVLDGREQLNSGPLLEQSVLLNALAPLKNRYAFWSEVRQK